MQNSYQLSAALQGHTADVRALYVQSDNKLLSASRDASAIVWKKGAKDNTWEAERSIPDSQGKFISALSGIESNGQAYFVLGSASGTISLHAVEGDDSVPHRQLRGHSKNVCALDCGHNTAGEPVLLSGSWDQSAIVWQDLHPALRLDSHLQAVWDVKCVPGDKFLTASADKLIRLYSADGSLLRTYTGHSDCVRSLALTMDNTGFWSAGNDARVIRWSFDSTSPLAVYSGHDSFVYSVAALPDGTGCVSSGEDGTVRLWQDDKLVQSIPHPTISVWTVAVLSNGDIVSGASDALVRIWTKNPARLASDEQREKLERDLRTRALNKTQVGDVNTTDLPGREALKRPGAKEGQVIMVKAGDKVEAYQWSTAETTWQQIGEVTDAVGSNRKQIYQGIEYDYVFDVDIAENMPPLKLPYNATDNMYTVAEKFLLKNDLPTTYLDQIVKFLETNTGAAALGTNNASDPFTGGSSYRATGNGSAPPEAQYRDPFTGGGAYTSTSQEPSSAASNQNSHQGGQAPASVAFVPIRLPQYFKTINAEAIKKKIAEFGAVAEAQQGLDTTPTSTELAAVTEICNYFSTTRAAGSSSSLEPSAEQRLCQLCLTWPREKRFPLLDLIRQLCATSDAIAQQNTDQGETLAGLLLMACEWNSPWETTKSREVNTMLVMRSFANLSATSGGRELLVTHEMSEVLGSFASQHPFDSMNKNIRVAMSTIALNLSVLAVDDILPSSHAPVLLQYILNMISNETSDGEVAYRSMVALGNLLGSSRLAGGLPVGDVQIAKELANGLAATLGEPRLRQVAVDLERL